MESEKTDEEVKFQEVLTETNQQPESEGEFEDIAETKKQPKSQESNRENAYSMKKQAKKSRRNISKITIRRLARRGGVRRISSSLYDDSTNHLKSFLKGVIEDAAIYSEYAKRKTVSEKDVVYALKKQGITLYGFGA